MFCRTRLPPLNYAPGLAHGKSTRRILFYVEMEATIVKTIRHEHAC